MAPGSTKKGKRQTKQQQQAAAATDAKIPVTVLTGFLGSGKTVSVSRRAAGRGVGGAGLHLCRLHTR